MSQQNITPDLPMGVRVTKTGIAHVMGTYDNIGTPTTDQGFEHINCRVTEHKTDCDKNNCKCPRSNLPLWQCGEVRFERDTNGEPVIMCHNRYESPEQGGCLQDKYDLEYDPDPDPDEIAKIQHLNPDVEPKKVTILTMFGKCVGEEEICDHFSVWCED